jgi:hypothetical protein
MFSFVKTLKEGIVQVCAELHFVIYLEIFSLTYLHEFYRADLLTQILI